MQTITDALDVAIAHAQTVRANHQVGTHRWDELTGAIEVASYMRGYLNGMVEVDPVIRQAVATALDLVTR